MKVWTSEICAFIETTRGMPRTEALAKFRERYPEMNVTPNAFFTARSRLGVATKAPNNGQPRKKRGLYAERVRRGYVYIKIAIPAVWVSKAKWVYMETHPWEDCSEPSNYVFLDGDNRNFDPRNIERVPSKLMPYFNQIGSNRDKSPELTRLNILRARLRYAQLDALERCGEIVDYGAGRIEKRVMRERVARYVARNKELLAERRREKYQKNRKEAAAKQRAYRARVKARKESEA